MGSHCISHQKTIPPKKKGSHCIFLSPNKNKKPLHFRLLRLLQILLYINKQKALCFGNSIFFPCLCFFSAALESFCRDQPQKKKGQNKLNKIKFNPFCKSPIFSSAKDFILIMFVFTIYLFGILIGVWSLLLFQLGCFVLCFCFQFFILQRKFMIVWSDDWILYGVWFEGVRFRVCSELVWWLDIDLVI